MYDVNSKCADDFISHEEILDTLAYADENKENAELIDALIEKAKLRKGLTHREASVLLACEIKEKNEEIFKLAEQIKKDFYGNRIVMFAPLYLSNYCINSCTYCPYHLKNKHIARKKLTQEEIRREVIALQDMGHKRLALEAGEDPDFGRKEFNGKVETGPFVISKLEMHYHLTFGGLVIDMDAHVLDEAGQPISGLYAAGDVTSGYEGAAHQSGDCLSVVVYYGKTAGVNAAQGK